MSNLSPFTIEQRLIASVWVHERAVTGKSMFDIRNDFMIRFNVTKAPNIETLYNWERKVFTSGSVLDSLQVCRPQERQQCIPAFEESVEKDLKLSIRGRAQEQNVFLNGFKIIPEKIVSYL